jgi:hypothetical protein
MDGDLVAALRFRGVSVVTALEAGLTANSDEVQWLSQRNGALFSIRSTSRISIGFTRSGWPRGENMLGSFWQPSSVTRWVNSCDAFCAFAPWSPLPACATRSNFSAIGSRGCLPQAGRIERLRATACLGAAPICFVGVAASEGFCDGWLGVFGVVCVFGNVARRMLRVGRSRRTC